MRSLPRFHFQSTLIALSLAILLAGLTGCGGIRIGGSESPDQALYSLRNQNDQLQNQVQKLQRQIDLRVAQIQQMQARSATTQPALPGVKPSDLPRPVAVEFDRYTGPIDTNNDGNDDTIRLYASTIDQFDQFIPLTAQATVQVIAIQPNVPPRTIVEKTFTPEQLRQNYHSGLTGTHYTLTVPLPQQKVCRLREVTVVLTMHDAGTGAVLTVQRLMRLTFKPAA